MTLQVIKAEEVRDGEPRWFTHPAFSDDDMVYVERCRTAMHERPLEAAVAGAFPLAIVDRPAPTPTPAPGLDLDAVERAERAMTPPKWLWSGERKCIDATQLGTDGAVYDRYSFGPVDIDELWDDDDAATWAADAAGIVALRNAAPALIAEVRALRAQVCRLVSGQAIESDALCQHHDADLAALAECDKARVEIARLTAELGAVTALHLEAITREGERDATIGEIGALVGATSGHGSQDDAGMAHRYRRDTVAKVRELAAARAVPADVEAAIEEHGDACYERGHVHAGGLPDDSVRSIDRDEADDRLRVAIARAISDATDARGTVGGLLAAGEERESRAWSEKGKAPPGSCPFCASRISMVQRDGYFIARCSHRGCGAVGPRMRSVSRAADLFCQPPRREAQGMSCGPIVASPQRPRCSCTHEAGDSRCNVHPTCSECGASTTRPVDGCEACRGPLPKGG